METNEFVSDADAMIDFVKATPNVIPLIVRHLGTVHLPIGVQEEIGGLDDATCRKLKLKLYEPTSADYLAAANLLRPKSDQDRMCLHLGAKSGWCVITNDKQLRACCLDAGVNTIRGLALVRRLVEKKVVSPTRAKHIATAIHRSNPEFINAQVLDVFLKEIENDDRR